MDSVYANDPRLGDLIDTNSCDVISFYLNMTLVSKPSISFTMPPGLTLLKCTIVSAQLDQQTDDFSLGNASYRGCHGYTVYCEFPPNIIWLQLLATFLPIVQLFNCQWYQKLKTKMPVICSLRCLPSSLLDFMCERHVISVAKREADVCDTSEFMCIKDKEGICTFAYACYYFGFRTNRIQSLFKGSSLVVNGS